MSKDTFEYYIELVWPEIRAQRGLPETAEPTNDDIRSYLADIADQVHSAGEDR